MNGVKNYLSLVKFSHTIFALPFAFIGFVLGAQYLHNQQVEFEKIELKQTEADQNFEKLFKALEERSEKKSQGIFFNGQIFDSYKLISDIIKTANESIVLIDNYIDETTLTHLAKKKKEVQVFLLTKKISKALELDVKKANEQYGHINIKTFTQSHDRFLIIDNKE